MCEGGTYCHRILYLVLCLAGLWAGLEEQGELQEKENFTGERAVLPCGRRGSLLPLAAAEDVQELCSCIFAFLILGCNLLTTSLCFLLLAVRSSAPLPWPSFVLTPTSFPCLAVPAGREYHVIKFLCFCLGQALQPIFLGARLGRLKTLTTCCPYDGSMLA